MNIKDNHVQHVRKFQAEHGIDGTAENIITAIHLMNDHTVDYNSAIDQTSRSGYDYGIDGWYYDVDSKVLFIYQSKLTESKPTILLGVSSLLQAGEWLRNAIIDDNIGESIKNTSIGNLVRKLSAVKDEIKQINLILLSPFNNSDLGTAGIKEAHDKIRLSEFFKQFVKRGIKINYEPKVYNLSSNISIEIKKYPVTKIPETTIIIEGKAKLDLSYVSLYSLVKLYEQRGDVLFHKNVRYSLASFNDSKQRVVNPMRKTLDDICSGKLDPGVFAFYHVGITIAAASSEAEFHGEESLESPFVLNGCQTISIAHQYYLELKKAKKDDKIQILKNIQVIAKIVVGASDELVRDITISNNRQNAIENWQLFSNDPIHCNVEKALEDIGVFYERQKGKFNSLSKKTSVHAKYQNTNDTFIDLETLGQIIAICKEEHQLSAKPSLIFVTKEQHDKIFDDTIHLYPRDILYTFNLFKAVKRAIDNSVTETYADQENVDLFKKPIVRAHLWWILMLYAYQRPDVFEKASKLVNKKAQDFLTSIQSFATRKLIREIKQFYRAKQGVKGDVHTSELTPFFKDLAVRNKIDLKMVPFSSKGRDWTND